jgi:alpha-ketoglutarate-dependent taurine dioxygenase
MSATLPTPSAAQPPSQTWPFARRHAAQHGAAWHYGGIMTDAASSKATPRGPRAIRRTGIGGPSAALVDTSPLYLDRALPVLIRPALSGVQLLAWAAANSDAFETHLHTAGAVLLRGFGACNVEQFEGLMAALYPNLVTEHERSSPRHQVSGSVYTSTDHPADQTIFLHNEMSYSDNWPMRIGFFCVTAPSTGGETPIADTREVLRLIPPAIRERFEAKGVMYIRNYGDGLGLSWQTSFQTDDRAEVEEYCRVAGLVPEWKDGDRLRTRRVGAALARHPRTGETVWFNHATFFHVSTLEPALRDALLADLSPDDLPTNSCYGDGSPIEPEVLDTLRDCYLRVAVSFPWQGDDILLIDNMLTAHARAPFSGPRKIVVAMAEPVTERETAVTGGTSR